MTLAFQDVAGEIVVGGLLSGIDVDGGPTSEQLAVLSALGTHYLGCQHLDLASIERVDPQRLDHVYRSRLTLAERPHRIIQLTYSRRVLEQPSVRLTARGAGAPRGLATAIQS